MAVSKTSRLILQARDFPRHALIWKIGMVATVP